MTKTVKLKKSQIRGSGFGHIILKNSITKTQLTVPLYTKHISVKKQIKDMRMVAREHRGEFDFLIFSVKNDDRMGLAGVLKSANDWALFK